jgi:hypothetical protein
MNILNVEEIKIFSLVLLFKVDDNIRCRYFGERSIVLIDEEFVSFIRLASSDILFARKKRYE